MTVFVAQKNYDYEGSELLGVYSTEERAMLACEDEYKNAWRNYPDYLAKSWAWTQAPGKDQPWTGEVQGMPFTYYTVTATELDEW